MKRYLYIVVCSTEKQEEEAASFINIALDEVPGSVTYYHYSTHEDLIERCRQKGAEYPTALLVLAKTRITSDALIKLRHDACATIPNLSFGYIELL